MRVGWGLAGLLTFTEWLRKCEINTPTPLTPPLLLYLLLSLTLLHLLLILILLLLYLSFLLLSLLPLHLHNNQETKLRVKKEAKETIKMGRVGKKKVKILGSTCGLAFVV